jgi:outer membrane immunogenic protein
MKKFLLAATALVALAAPAVAADMPGKRIVKPTFAPVPVFTWTGVYVGVNAGYSFGEARSVTRGTTAFQSLAPLGITPDRLSSRGEGFAGGAQAGFNYQFGAIVAGIEGDIQYVDQSQHKSFTGLPVLGTALTTSNSQELKWLGTLRGRIGFLPTERLMVYGTGGFAFGEVETTGSVVGVAAPGLVWSGSNSGTRTGFAIGGGAEYAITDQWSLKGEYLHYDLGRKTVNATGNAAVRGVAALNGIDYISRSETKGAILRAGLNYRF